LKSKAAEEVGVKLIQILSTAVIPEILQSDNGNEFFGKCIQIIKSFYPYIHIIKGRAYHPQMQGKVERGHAPFKEALQKWMAKHGTNWMIGAFVVNHEINQRAQWNRENLSPYNMMYVKLGTQRNNVVFGEAAVTHAKTEYGVLCAKFFYTKAKTIAPSRLVSEAELKYVMQKGDEIYDDEVNERIVLPQVENLMMAIKAAIRDSLIHLQYSTYRCNAAKDGLSDSDDDDYLVSEIHATPEKGNYYRREMCNIKNSTTVRHTLAETDNNSEDDSIENSNDDDLSMTQHVLQHRSCIKPKQSKTTMCSIRAAMELMAYQSQKKQAEKLNAKRAADTLYKHVLEVGDIGLIYVQPKNRSSCDHP